MQEHLLGYLLGALDPVTHQRVHDWLQAHPDEQARLGLLEQAVAPLADDGDTFDPPPGLALATLARVAEHRCALPPAPRPAAPEAPPPRRGLRRIDWLVAACLLLLLGGLGTPLVARLWYQQQRVACGNNLRQFWVALQGYSDRGGNDFPRVEPSGPRGVAGIFVPTLIDAGLLRDVSIGCPAQGHRQPPGHSVADLERLYRDRPPAYLTAARALAGDYAYCLGYTEGERLRGLRRDSGDGLPILADCAGGAGSNSPNHGGAGQNVLYVGGHVRWATRPTVGESGDHIFLNHHYRVGAGVCRGDTVLGPSDARPVLDE